MLNTQHSRRLDSLGRLVIPSKLREQYGLETGVEYTFYAHEVEGQTYLCIPVKAPGESELEKAKALLAAAGYQVADSRE